MSNYVDPHSSELYFEYYEIHVYRQGRRMRAYLSAENKLVYFQTQADWFESAADAYRRIKRLPKGLGLFVIEKVTDYPDCGPSPGPCPELIRKALDEIPLPYSLAAVRWYDGIDVKREPVLLSTLSRSTYYRHRRKLLEYGIDISKKCNVHIIYFKWHQIRNR